jgi:hypothetical protein
MGDQMKLIADGSMRWSIVHWAAAASLSFFAVAGLVALAAGSRLTQDWWTSTAVAAATVIFEAAASGNRAAFETWWAFSEGKANGFAAMALAFTVIAGNEALSAPGTTPIWASWVAAAAGAASFGGWVLGSWLGFAIGGPIWVVSSVVMCLWLLWFGLSLLRTEVGLVTRQTEARSKA